MNTNKFASVFSFLGILAVCALSTGCAARVRGTARGTIYTTTPTVYVEPAYVPPPPPVFVPPPAATVGGSVYVNVPPITVYGGGGVSIDAGSRPFPRHRHCGNYGCR